MDKLVVSDVNADVADVAAAGVEAEDIAGLKIGGVDMNAVRGLIGCNSVDIYSEMLEHIVDEARTVKPGFGGRAAPAVFIAEISAGKIHYILTCGGRADGCFRGVGIRRVIGRVGAFTDIFCVDIPDVVFIYDLRPIAGCAGDGDLIAVKQLIQNLGCH